MLVLGLPLFASLLGAALCADPPDHEHHRHLPDTAPDMDLKPAFQRTTEPPPHRHHSHDFSLPLPGRGRTTEPDYDVETMPFLPYDGPSLDYVGTVPYKYNTKTSTDYSWDASGDEETGHDHGWTAEVDDSRDSLNDQLASDADENKLKSTLLLLLALTFLLIT